MSSPAAPSSFASHFGSLQQELACPACHGALQLSTDHLKCSDCGREYPVVNGIPILIREAASQPK